MSASRLFSSPQRTFLTLGIILLSLNLRPSINAVAPLAQRMADDGLSLQLIGHLTSLPILLFGIAGLFAGSIGVKLGFSRALGLGLTILIAGIVLRSLSSAPPVLLAGSALIGRGISLGNVLLPGVVKARFPEHTGILTGIYSTAIGVGSALGIATSISLADGFAGGWSGSLQFWALPAGLAFLIWLPQVLARPIARSSDALLPSLSYLTRQPLAWSVTLHMGFLSLLFFSAIAWLPSILQARGMSEEAAGFWIGLTQIFGCISSLTLPRLAARREKQSLIVLLSNAAIVISLLGIWLLPVALVPVLSVLLGLGLSGSFSLCLLLINLRSADARTTGQLSAMSQAFGYLIGAPGPWFLGFLFASTQSWSLPVLFLTLAGLATAASGWWSGKNEQLSLP